MSSSTSSARRSTASSKRLFIITGSNTGVGYETAKQLAVGDVNSERQIILACRTPEKAEAAVEKIMKALPEGRTTVVEWMKLDLADLTSIESFISEFKKRGLALHVLINNAGVNVPPKLTPSFKVDGQFVANYLGPYVLTKGLLPILEKSAPSRILNVSSYMHRLGVTDFEKQCRLRNKDSYATSKLAQIYHSYQLQREYGSKGVTSFVVHPGACNSDIWNTLRPAFLRTIVKPVAAAIFLTTEQGAAPSVYAATKEISTDPTECEHFGPYPAPLGGWEKLTDAWQPSYFTRVTKSKTSAVTYDQKIGDGLMALSEKLVAEWQEATKEDASA